MPPLSCWSEFLIQNRQNFQSLTVSTLLYGLADDLELRQQVYPHHGRSICHDSLRLILEGWQQQTKYHLHLQKIIDILSSQNQ